MQAQTSIGTLPDAPDTSDRPAPAIVAGATGMPATRDAWFETLQLLRSFQDNLSWEDFIVSTPNAVLVAETVMNLGLPFIALNGVTGTDFTWLWLSEDALGYIKHNCPGLMDHAVKVERGYYINASPASTARERVTEAVHVLEQDAQSAYWRFRNPKPAVD